MCIMILLDSEQRDTFHTKNTTSELPFKLKCKSVVYKERKKICLKLRAEFLFRNNIGSSYFAPALLKVS
jgi:hypothetical protein